MSTDLKVPQEMRIVYLQRRRADLVACHKAIDSADFEFLGKIGHQIRGNAESFGFEQLTPVGISLEKAAKNKDMNQARISVKTFEDVLKAISI